MDKTRVPMTTQSIPLYRICGGIANLARMSENAELLGDYSKIKVSKYGVIFKTKNNKTAISIPDPSGVLGSECRLQQVFVFILLKAGAELFTDDKLYQYDFTFSVHEMVECGIYSNYRTAIKGFREIQKFLSGLKVSFDDSSVYQELFNSISRIHGIIHVSLSTQIDWHKVYSKQISFSLALFKLDNLTFNFLMAILMQDIKPSKTRSISLSQIYPNLNLPDITTKNPKRDVKIPLRYAIDSLNQFSSETGFIIIPDYNENCPLLPMLQQGSFSIYHVDSQTAKAQIMSAEKFNATQMKMGGYVYKLLDDADKILYIGKTRDIKQRLREHRSRGHLPAECYDAVKWVEIYMLPTYADAGIVERYLIGVEKPKYNKQFLAEGRPTVKLNIPKFQQVREAF